MGMVPSRRVGILMAALQLIDDLLTLSPLRFEPQTFLLASDVTDLSIVQSNLAVVVVIILVVVHEEVQVRDEESEDRDDEDRLDEALRSRSHASNGFRRDPGSRQDQQRSIPIRTSTKQNI